MDEAFTIEQARELAALSRAIGRQIGLLIDRKGKVEVLMVGDTKGILIPELSRGRGGAGRLRGARLLHTHLTPELLSQEDLMDMLFLRLDAVCVLTVSPHGEPVQWQYAHLMPPNPENKPYMVYDPKAWDKTEADFTMVESLEEELRRELDGTKEAESTTRAILISVGTQARPVQEGHLDELADLAATAGLTVVGRVIQRVPKVNPKFILGRGKMAELEVQALQGHATVLVFDGELSPAQLHNLADITERKVLDRTQLILDIFAQHAVSSAGKLQVESAQLKYTQPRLVGKNRAMDRLMGGIGGRGPGETKLETDRRRVRDRIAKIKKNLDELRKQRAFTRGRRSRQGIPLVAIVGYTNAGKSTLLNTLTRSEVIAEDKLFATLDPTTRRLRFPQEQEVILADTVGFIRNLPKELKEAFQATLEELEAADVLLHVADASHLTLEQHLASVEEVLTDMQLGEVPRILVLNKWDSIDEEEKSLLRNAYPRAVTISAAQGTGLEVLLKEISDILEF